MTSSVTPRPPFRLEVEPHLEAVVVRAHGVLDAEAAVQLEACLCSLWEVGLQHLHLELSGVWSLSPEGEATVERWTSRARIATGTNPDAPSLP
jgi:hypothetical protein